MNIETTKRLKLTNEEFYFLNKAKDILNDIYSTLSVRDYINGSYDSDFKDVHDFLDKFINSGVECDAKGIVFFDIEER